MGLFMGKIDIIPGLYQQKLVDFLDSRGVLYKLRKNGLRMEGDQGTLITTLGEFFQVHCLLEEAKNILPEHTALRTEAAKRAVACAWQHGTQVLCDYLQEFRRIHLEGFICFRLRNVISEVRYLARLYAEELVQEEKYREFLMLLQSYVQECVPLVDTVLLLADTAGQHHLFTENGVEITYDYADLEDAASLSNEDDVILSSLLTIAPRVVYLYGEDRSSNPCLVDTIRKIFSVQEIC